MANVSIRVDDAVKQRAESICSELGMSLSTATNLFYKKHLEKVISNYYHGKSKPVHKNIEELEEMEG